MKHKFISFTDTSIAFSYKSDKALKKSYYLFAAIKNKILAKLGTNIVKFAIKVKAPIKGIIRKSIFAQFCGGESIADCEQTIKMLAKHNVGTILDYAVEGESGRQDFDRTLEEILKTVNRAAGDPDIPFCVFKPTGLGNKELLTKIQAKETLTTAEITEYNEIKVRFKKIAQRCYEKQVRLFIDSEDSWIQEPIDEITYALMEEFNREKPVVFNTYQFYRKQMLDHIKKAVQTGREKGYFIGAKLVRGAYMEKERERAEALGYSDPILSDKAATDKQYDEALKFCVENIDRIWICSGSHNEQSNQLLIDLMAKKGLKNNDDRIYFAQLYGMSDNISFNLANGGYKVVKYVPYGPVEAVLPYLFRRAEENTSIAGQSSRELEMVRKELRRRKEKRSN